MKDFLNYAMRIGEEMLVSGAEVHRVEDCLERICRARGATRTDVFIITSSMVLSVADRNGEIYTQTRRIHALGTDYAKLDALNSLCRRICAEEMSIADLDAALSRIEKERTYSFSLQVLVYAAVAAAFTLFFGGSLVQMVFLDGKGYTLKYRLNHILTPCIHPHADKRTTGIRIVYRTALTHKIRQEEHVIIPKRSLIYQALLLGKISAFKNILA